MYEKYELAPLFLFMAMKFDQILCWALLQFHYQYRLINYLFAGYLSGAEEYYKSFILF